MELGFMKGRMRHAALLAAWMGASFLTPIPVLAQAAPVAPGADGAGKAGARYRPTRCGGPRAGREAARAETGSL